MIKRAIVLSLIVAASVPALAATDDELAQKCVSGMKTVAPNGAQISYFSGGSLSGVLHRGSTNIGIQGTWAVKNGVMSFHSRGDTGQEQTGSFPIRMDDTGKCYMTTPAGEKPIER